MSGRSAFALVPIAAILLAAGCNDGPPPTGSYYDEHIGSTLQSGCLSLTAGCHFPTDMGTAAGNLDLTSYDALMRRKDVLPAFGPYPDGLLLMKASAPRDIQVQVLDPPDPSHPDQRYVTVRTDIRHNAGRSIELGSDAFRQIQHWIADGYARNGVPVENPPPEDIGECVPGIGVNNFEVNRFESRGPPDVPGFFERFTEEVLPVLQERCAGSRCHGNRLRTLYLNCGETLEEQRWDYFVATWHLSNPVNASELLRKPLSRVRGGDFHVGGDVFDGPDDPGYVALRDWASDLIDTDPSAIVEDYATEGFRYFVNRVQPMLVKKGCMFQNCHSPLAQNQDLQLFVGSRGSFGRAAQHRNHGAALALLALEAEDPNVSRIIAKNLYPPFLLPGGVGIAHRGGPLLEDFDGETATRELCDGYDADEGDLNEVPAYCILVRWHDIERDVAISQGRILPDPVSSVLWVSRPLGLGPATDFDTYRPGADLRIAEATVGPDGHLSLAPSRSLTAECGLSVDSADIRGPAVSWDGTTLAFAARSSADEPLRLYWMNEDGTGCERIPGIAAPTAMENGILTHDFDPAFAPDGQIVFASTRGNLDREMYDYAGPTRTPAAMEPNANLYAFAAFADPPLRQITYMLNQEMAPTFTNVGRIVYVQEKRQPGFHQLAMRQQNLDGGDFRPAFAARSSMGFESGTEPTVMLNRNLAFVASPLGAPDAAGTIGIANQSIGVDATDHDPLDRFYIRAMRVPDPGAVGGLRGVFRSPSVLPTRYLLVSCDPTADYAGSAPYDFDLCELDPSTGDVRVLAGEAGRAEVEGVAVFARYLLPSESIVPSDGEKLDRPTIEEGRSDAVVTFHDFPMLMGLMFDNKRGPRIVDDRIRGFDVLEVLPPPVGTESFADVAGEVVDDDFGQVFVRRRRLGHVPLLDDFSAAVRIPGGTPIMWRPTDGDGTPLVFPAGSEFEGLLEMPREQDQYVPGLRSNRAIPRRLFNHLCGFCHAGMSGRELDVAISPDTVSQASASIAAHTEPVDLAIPPSARAAPE